MEIRSIDKSQKTVLEWLILALTSFNNIVIAILGVLLLGVIGEIFGQIFGFLLVLVFLGILYAEYKFYSDNLWGWYFIFVAQASILLLSILGSYSQALLDLMNDAYLIVFKGFTEVIIQWVGGSVEYNLQSWLNDVIIAENSFLGTKSVLIGTLLSLIGVYWSIKYLSNRYSELEKRSILRKSLFLLAIDLLMLAWGVFLFVNENSLNIIIGGVVGSLGFILVFVLMKITLTEKYKGILSNIIMGITTTIVALFSFNLITSVLTIFSTVTIIALRHRSIKEKFAALGTAEQHEEQTAFTLVIPTMTVVVVIVLIPVIWVIIASFFDVGLRNLGPNAPSAEFVGISNYLKWFTDDEFYTAIGTSLLYTILGTSGSVLLGLVAALLLNRSFPGRGFIRSIMLFPYIASTVAMIFLWTWAFDGVYGVFNYLLLQLGVINSFEPWLDQTPYAFIVVVAFEIWKYFPFAMLMILARLQAIPNELYEAADIDGANEWQKFWHITLPELKYVLGVVVLLRTIWTFNKFDDVYLFTEGSIETGTLVLPIYIFDKVWTGVLFNISEAAAISVFLFLGLIAFATLFGKKILKW
ncbi:MAG: carbohydrate ABC transporter permease [Candidatus Hodarchaeales archaeon]